MNQGLGYLLNSFLILFLFCAIGVAADGDLDTSFGGDGKVTTNFGSDSSVGYAVAIQSDGKIVVAGYSDNGSGHDFALVRYNTDGSLDTSFDGDGRVTTNADSTGYEPGNAIAIQSDGKIVVAGDFYNGSIYDFAVVRYNTDGSLDISFDGDGMVTTDINSSYDKSHAVAIQADGKIVVAGFSIDQINDFAVVRYNIDGSLDTSFDDDGMVTTNFNNGSQGNDIAIQPDGKIVVVGYFTDPASPDFALVRYNTNGSLDTSFDGDGMVTTALSIHDDDGYDVAIQPDGKIVVAGWSDTDSGPNFALVRYKTNGSLDTSFDGDGIVTTDFGSYCKGRALSIQPDGKIVVAGTSYGLSAAFAVARYNTDGTLDTSFDGDGMVVTTDFGGYGGEGHALSIQSDGKIVVAGSSEGDFAVVRYVGACASRPASPTLTSPTGTINQAMSTYLWDSTSCADHYYLLIQNQFQKTIFNQRYPAATVDNGDGTCSINPLKSLLPGGYFWLVRGQNQHGTGPNSTKVAFAVATTQVPPAAPTLNTPTGTIVNTTPTFDWDEVANTDYYYLLIQNKFQKTIFKKRYPTATVGNGDGTCSIDPGKVLAPGEYYWLVRAKNQYGFGPASAKTAFEIE